MNIKQKIKLLEYEIKNPKNSAKKFIRSTLFIEGVINEEM